MKLHGNRLHSFVLSSALLAATAAAPIAAEAATVVVVNADGAGEGFNDPTAAAPVGGNTGTTVGAQRLIAFTHAANIWASRLASTVPIRVRGQFNPLSCSTNSGTLGQAGPTNFFRDFTGAPAAGTWFPVALANAKFGSDIDPGNDDISATFSSTIGTPGCLQNSGWYYGLDANSPNNRIDFVTVLAHELGHGLGFLTIVDLGTGAKALGFNDTYMRFLENHAATPPDYPSMSNPQRVAASISSGNLHWTGANVRAASGVLSAGKVGDHVRMFAPNPQQPGSSVSHFDTVATPNQLMEPSYTVPLHTPVLELPLFRDIGWTVAAPAVKNDFLVDFGGSGLWQRLNNATWSQIHTTNPVSIAADDLDGGGKDEAIATFAGGGLWARYNNATWTRLHTTTPIRVAAGDFDGNGKAEVAADFAGGLFAFYNNTTWVKLFNTPSVGLAVGDIDGNGKKDLIADRGGGGLWVWLNNAGWAQLHTLSPNAITTGDLDGNNKDEIIIDLPGQGIRARYNNATAWLQLHPSQALGLSTGDLDSGNLDDLLVRFNGGGLWARFNNATWTRLHATTPENVITGDLDSSGRKDAIVEFGAGGLWVYYNNTNWLKQSNFNSEALASGGFD